MRICSVASALPDNFYDQETIVSRLEQEWGDRHFNTERLRRLHQNVLVGGRHLALPLEEFDALGGFGDANDAWIRVGIDVGGRALEQALSLAGVAPESLDALFFVSVTGLAVPSLDARLVHRLGLNPSVKRTPIFGLGCVAGAAGVARAADYVRAFPEHTAALLSVELCSLTVQREDLSIPNLIATGLFGDGAAAVVLGGSSAAPALSSGPEVIATRSVLYPDSEDVMGWTIGENGFEIVLSARVPQMVADHLRADVDAFLAEEGLRRRDIGTWICHPGGPKVLQAMAEALEVDESAFDLTWKGLREVGNLSSTSVLMVLEETLADPPPAGSFGVLLAMGPGFCSELVLLRF
ncbi:MAG: 3-oxoacyl-[acyl-carrier-protein] synthase III C-terminal domain-containing protein [Acidobacteriota bacterium]